MFLGLGIKAAIQKANQPEMNHPQFSCSNSGSPIKKVEVKNIKSAGCCGSLAQLQRKLLQHLDHMLLVTYILLQTIRKNPFYHIFFLGDHQVFRFVWLHIQICRLHFSMSFLNILIDNVRDTCYQNRIEKMY